MRIFLSEFSLIKVFNLTLYICLNIGLRRFDEIDNMPIETRLPDYKYLTFNAHMGREIIESQLKSNQAEISIITNCLSCWQRNK